jgi:hypothetical protein
MLRSGGADKQLVPETERGALSPRSWFLRFNSDEHILDGDFPQNTIKIK